MTRPPRVFVAASLLSWLLVSCALSPPAPPPRPHIVLLLADDLGWGDVGFHGSQIATPHIDALADRGVRLEQFYAQPVCSPTRGALLTGRYPMRLGLQCGVIRPWAQHGLPLNERTLASALRDAGYATALCGKWHLGHATRAYLPTQRGFDRQYGHYNGNLDYFTHIRDGGLDWHENDRVNRDEGYATDLIADAAIEVLTEHDQARPLFLYVPFNAPHTPLQAPERYIAKYAHIKDKRRRVYAAMVACLDDAVGRITAALREQGFGDEETLVLFCSDNGGVRRLGSNGILRAGKGTLYEGGVRVPAVISWPGRLPAGILVHEPLHIVDLYPTLLRLAGASLAQPLPLDGRDCWPVLAAGAQSPHELIVHNVTPWSGAIRVGDWKIIHNGRLGVHATKGPKRETWQLFNIAEDPGERRDLRSQQPAIFARLQEQLQAVRATAVKPNMAPNSPPTGFEVPAVWGER